MYILRPTAFSRTPEEGGSRDSKSIKEEAIVDKREFCQGGFGENEAEGMKTEALDLLPCMGLEGRQSRGLQEVLISGTASESLKQGDP